MPVGDLVSLSATARLVGLSATGPDGRRHLQFGWIRDTLRRSTGRPTSTSTWPPVHRAARRALRSRS
jgi:hypothetical protein